MESIKGFPYHRITKDGRVWSVRKRRFLKGTINRHGYIVVSLSNRKKKAIHRLVVETFLPNPMSFDQTNHKDGNKLNNSVDNLEWCNNSMNQYHAFYTGLKPLTAKWSKKQPNQNKG